MKLALKLWSISPSAAIRGTEPQGWASGASATGGVGRGVEAQALSRSASDASSAIAKDRFAIKDLVLF
jgi:hypothetical protein